MTKDEQSIYETQLLNKAIGAMLSEAGRRLSEPSLSDDPQTLIKITADSSETVIAAFKKKRKRLKVP